MARLKVEVWIYRWVQEMGKYRFLLLKTREDRGSFWQPVTGGVEPGESLEFAAIREAKEETGLSFPEGPRPIGYSFEFESRWGGKAIEHGFGLEVSPSRGNQDPAILLDPQEHQESQWVDESEVHQWILHPSNYEMYKTLLKQLKSSR
jgi:dATP pyrophosphohydrolase